MPQIAQQDELRIYINSALDEPSDVAAEVAEQAKRLAKQGILLGAILTQSSDGSMSRIVEVEFDSGELYGFSYIYSGDAFFAQIAE